MPILRRCVLRARAWWGLPEAMPTYADRKLVGYRPEQLFDLVADVERYPEFLPWCVGARIRSRTPVELHADLTIGFGPFRETFGSKVLLERPRLIRVSYERGPFKYLNNQWVFIAHEDGVQVDFWVDFEFRNVLLQKAIGVVFNEAVRLMVGAFVKRARDVYGPPFDAVPVPR
jgi:coenzyme Q-binding protein COQ10